MRLVVVSNRLPITMEYSKGKLNYKESSGGLVSGLSSYLDSLKNADAQTEAEYVWVGWPGIEVKENDQENVQVKLRSEFNSFAVFLSKNLMENFYQGFCNKSIWPLFHYFPSFTEYNEEHWNTYKEVNEIFCEALLKILKPDDYLWIHDYHVMLLPKLIREKMPNVKIGFFLHIPFPTFEIFSLLPSKWRVEIIEGLLGADIIGFHTHDYTQYFLRCVLRILGIDSDLGRINYNGRVVEANTFPMGIDYSKFQNVLTTDKFIKEKNNLRANLKYEKIILSIDRLDYTKGILNRLYAYELFLENNQEWHERIKLLLQIIPSRIGVNQYGRLKKQIDEQVGRINGRFGSFKWIPISYQFGFVDFEPLVAMYNIADVMLVTPLRDGMNLISKEYLASKDDHSGVLILSEMAGSSKELGEALVVNPNYKEEIGSAIKTALEMPLEDQAIRNRLMHKRLKRYNVVRWAEDFITSLDNVVNEVKRSKSRLVNNLLMSKISMECNSAEKSIIFLDYDGTLVPFNKDPNKAAPGDDLLELIKNITNSHNIDLVLISGRDKNTIESWFGHLGVQMIAEHGAWIKFHNSWELLKPLDFSWKPQIQSIFEIFTDRLPGSFIEEKDFSLAWHFRKSEPDLALVRQKELLDYLFNITSNKELQVLKGSKVIEVRNAGINKGIAALNFLSKKYYNFILAIGDDWTDEDLFNALPTEAYTIKVGYSNSNAKFNTNDYKNVIELLKIIEQEKVSS